jgi:CBS domain containing-hemolysin-like protein
VLFLSDIIPNVVGVAYSRPISLAMALPRVVGSAALYPIVWVIAKLSTVFKPDREFAALEEELNQLVMMSVEEGSIMAI